MFTKCVKHLKNQQLVLFILRGRESHSISELRSWWQTSGASWRPEERETSSTSICSPCLLTTGFPRLSSTLEYCGTLMHWCRRWRKVREQTRGCLSCQAQNAFSKKNVTFHIFMSGVWQASCSLLETGKRSRSEAVRFGLWSWSKSVFASWCRRETRRHAASTRQLLTSTCGLMPSNITKRWPTFPYTTPAVFTTDKLAGNVMYSTSAALALIHKKSRASGASGCPVAVESVVMPESW